MLRHRLLCKLDESLLIRRPRTWKELDVTVLRAEHVAHQHSIDVVLGDDRGLELGKVETVSYS